MGVLDIHYAANVGPQRRPRLNVVLEWSHDAMKFDCDSGFGFDETKHDCVRAKFASLSAEHGTRLDTSGLFVIFSSFEAVARIEANERVTENALESLKSRLNNPELWHIARIGDFATFFFYTAAQARSGATKDLSKFYSQEYARVITPYDEFGYLAKTSVRVGFDSKENFDTNYQSNWFYYYKG